MSRTTTVGAPLTVPITRLSPAGTALSQWTREGPPGVPVGGEGGLEEGGAGALGEVGGWGRGVGDFLGMAGEPPHADRVRATANDRTRLGRTAVTVSASGSVVQAHCASRALASCAAGSKSRSRASPIRQVLRP